MASETQNPKTDSDHPMPSTSSGSPKELIKIQDISQKTPMPSHLQHLMNLKGDNDFISIHEWAARLSHALMVEVGFFPAFNGPPNMSALNALDLPDALRIPHFVKQLPTSCMFSEQGIYALKYKAILSELVDTIPVENSETGDSVIDSSTEKASSNNESTSAKQETLEPTQEWKYSFSNDINVTIIIKEDHFMISANYNPGQGKRPVSHQMKINIEEFLVVRVRMVPVRLRGDQWIRKFELNSARFSGYFKNKFAIYLMDQIEGVLFERRGLISLPYIALIKILKMSSIKTIMHMSRSCVYMYNVIKDNRLWKFLLKRDFPNEPHIFTPSPEVPVKNEPISSDDLPDFYEIYKHAYISKYKRLHRMNSFPLRTTPNLLVGRRPRPPFHFEFDML